jgi:hypothetical protein
MLNEIKERWKSETPIFFKKLRNMAMTLGSSATALWLTNESMSLHLPDGVMNVCKYTIAACAAMGITSQLTKETPSNG